VAIGGTVHFVVMCIICYYAGKYAIYHNNINRNNTHWASPTSAQTSSTNASSRATVATNINMYHHIYTYVFIYTYIYIYICYAVCMCDEHGGSRNNTPHICSHLESHQCSKSLYDHTHTQNTQNQTNTTPVFRHSSGCHGMAFSESATFAYTRLYNYDNRIVRCT
jgi:hypothetical protein